MTDQPTNQENQAPKAKTANSTQAYLNIKEVKDGVLVLKDGSLRQVLMTSSLNFALKSNAEQDGIIYAYQRFLNSLTHPVQILVQSRRLDLDYYLDKLNKRADSQAIELVKLQILEYTEFIKRLISVTNIMDKRFFVVVPFYPTGTEPAKGLAKLFSTGGSKQAAAKAAEQQFENNKVQLRQRIEAVAAGLGGLGLRAVTLNSEELVELFYSIYNPGTSTKERLLNVDELTAASIQRDGGVPPEVLANVEAAQMASGQSGGVVPPPADQPAPAAPATEVPVTPADITPNPPQTSAPAPAAPVQPAPVQTAQPTPPQTPAPAVDPVQAPQSAPTQPSQPPIDPTQNQGGTNG